MKGHTRSHLILGPVLSASLFLVVFCTSGAAQGAKTDPSSVNVTLMPVIGRATAVSGSSNASPRPVNHASFSGNPYTVGPVITPTTTGPEAEEHIAVAPVNSSTLVSAISDFSRPLAGFLVNTTKLASSVNNGANWMETFVPEGADKRPITSDGMSWDANSDPVVAMDK